MPQKDKEMNQIVRPLLDWYHVNRRNLPWRENRDPYRIWVSEVMLQQTRVETVIPYYERFMEHFPTVALLAACEDEELFKLWEGLGYYSRAGNLKKAAQVICTRYQGRFPDRYEEILGLPGIGSYTAGAVSSIAFEEARAAVDGNVLRVITRLTEDSRDIMDAKFRKEVTGNLEKIYPSEERGDFTQSLMELGAVVCVPNGVPRCGECPLSFLCDAYKNKTQLQYPVRKKKAARKIEEKTILILQSRDRIAIRKRDKEGILSGMWELPNLDGKRSKKQILRWLAERGLVVKTLCGPVNGGQQMKHIFTHIEWHMTCWTADCEFLEDSDLVWITRDQLETDIALPTAFKKVYRTAVQER